MAAAAGGQQATQGAESGAGTQKFEERPTRCCCGCSEIEGKSRPSAKKAEAEERVEEASLKGRLVLPEMQVTPKSAP